MAKRVDLRELLVAYAPSPLEARTYSEMMELLESSNDVLSRFHFYPGHFTASAFVLSSDHSRMVLIRHVRLDRWLQPGGHVEPTDEDLEAAARREVMEEARLQDLEVLSGGVFDLDIHRIPASQDEPSHCHYDVRFLFLAEGEVEAGAGVAESRWVALSKVGSFTTDESVRRAVFKIRDLI